MVDLVSKKSYDLNDLIQIVKILRGPGGCQWDGEQTHQSIRRNFLEEAYEVAEAIDRNPRNSCRKNWVTSCSRSSFMPPSRRTRVVST